MENQKTWKAGNNTGNERYFSQSPLSPRLARIKNRNTGVAAAAAIRKFSRPPPPLLPFSPTIETRGMKGLPVTKRREAKRPANNTAKNNIYYRSLGKDNGRERLSLIVNSCHLRLQSNLGWLYNSSPRVVLLITRRDPPTLGHQLKCSSCENSLALYKGENGSRKIALAFEELEIIALIVSLLIKILIDRSFLFLYLYTLYRYIGIFQCDLNKTSFKIS